MKGPDSPGCVNATSCHDMPLHANEIAMLPDCIMPLYAEYSSGKGYTKNKSVSKLSKKRTNGLQLLGKTRAVS